MISYSLLRRLGLALALFIVAPVNLHAQAPPPPPAEAMPGPEAALPSEAAPTDPAGSASAQSNDIAELKRQIQILQKRVEDLEKARAVPPTTSAPAPETPAVEAPAEAAPGEGEEARAPSAASGRALLLPDISLIGSFIGGLSSDKRNELRNRIVLEEAEIGIQSFVYPGVKADAFIVMPRDNGHQAELEEAYLTALNLGKGLSMRVGKSKVPFGRVNQLHPHSWLYVTQPSALANLLAPESLTGEGAYLSYLIPTPGKLFAQLDAGYWNGAEKAEFGDPSDTSTIFHGAGAAFDDRFSTLRLWTSYPLKPNTELELGASYARGAGAIPPGETIRPRVGVTGADLSYRVFQGNNKRLLLRGEYLWRRSARPDYPTAQGFYLLADQRLDAYREFGLRYDWSEFPYAPGLRESSMSAIFTNQLTEQTYLRLQLTHGSRPGKHSYNEMWLQWVWGVGPHTHNLE